MREGLREVPKLPLVVRIVFLGEQAEIVAETQQPLEDSERVLAPPLQRVVVGEPKAARQECAFTTRYSIDVLFRAITLHEPIPHQLALDRGDGAQHT